MSLMLLIAEDDAATIDVLESAMELTWPGCRVIVARDGQEALERFAEVQPDLVILDIALPRHDGFEVCRRMRQSSPVPILVISGRSATVDKVRALRLGADDYLTKPFDLLELDARVQALVRRAGASPAHSSPGADFVAGDLEVDFATHEVRVRGVMIRLTSTEYRLLETLVLHAGTTLPHRLLLEKVWGPESRAASGYLKVFVRRLRRKIGDDPERPRYIKSEWGVGYRFVPASPPESAMRAETRRATG